MDQAEEETLSSMFRENQKWKFEFKKGELVTNTDSGVLNSTISFFKPLPLVALKLYELFLQPQTSVYLFNVLLYACVRPSITGPWIMAYNASYLIMMVILKFFFFFFFQTQVKRMEQQWNKMEIERIKLTKHGISSKVINISQLRVGDIVCLKADTIAPADILVLDSSYQRHADKIFQVSERREKGANKVMSKVSVRNLNPQKHNHKKKKSKRGGIDIPSVERVFKKLQGQIEYDKPNGSVRFGGTLKLKNDSKVSRITLDNILLCGTKLMTSWVLGMVLYTGQYTKVMQKNYYFKMNKLRLKKTKIYTIAVKFSLLVLSVSFMSTFIFALLVVYNPQRKFQLKAMRLESSYPFTVAFFELLSSNLSILSHYCFIFIDSISFYISFGLEYRRQRIWAYFKAKWRIFVQKMSIRFLKSRRKPRGGFGGESGLGSSRRSKVTLKEASIKEGSFASSKPSTKIDFQNKEKETLSGTSIRSSDGIRRSTATTIQKVRYGSGKSDDIEGDEWKKSIFKRQIRLGFDGKPAPQDLLKITNYSILGDLGCINHIVFDKTDTLTTSKLEIQKVVTLSRCYSIDVKTIADKLIEIKTPGNNLALNDSHDEINKECESYSEKSQEYLEEMDGDFNPRVCDEDSTWTDMIQNLEQPSYRLEINSDSESNLSKRDHNFLEFNKQDTMSNKEHGLSFIRQKSGANAASAMSNSRGNLSNKLRSMVSEIVQANRKAPGPQLPGQTNILNRSFKNLPNEEEYVDQEEKEDSREAQSPSITFKASKEFPFNKFIKDIYFRREELEWFLGYVTLMNVFTTEGERNSRALGMEDRAIDDMLKNLNFKLSVAKRNKDSTAEPEYRIKIGENILKDYRILGVNFFTNRRDRLSLVIQDMSQSSGEAILLVKGTDKSMFDIISMKEHEKNQYRELMAAYKTSGLKQLVYAQKTMDEETVQKFKLRYQEILKSTREQIESFESLAIDMEKDLYFCGCFGVRDNICPNAMKLTRILQEAGIRVSIFSGDIHDNCMNVAQTMNLVSGGQVEASQFFKIIDNGPEQIALTIRLIMDQLCDDMKAMNQDEMKKASEEVNKNDSSALQNKLSSLLNTPAPAEALTADDYGIEDDTKSEISHLTHRVLMLEGGAIDVIARSKLLTSQFRSLLIFCSTIIGYSMQPSHKAFLVELLQKKGDVVMAVGDGFNDIGMLQQANIGVQLISHEVPVTFSDISVGNIGLLGNILFVQGASIYRNLIRGAFLFFWIAFTSPGFHTILFYQTSVYSELIIAQNDLTFGVLTLVAIILFTFERPYNQEIVQEFPIIYRENEILGKRAPVLSMGIVILSVIEVAIVATCQTVFLQTSTLEKTAFKNNYNVWESSMVIICFLSSVFKIWLLSTHRSRILWIGYLLVGLSVIPFEYWQVKSYDVTRSFNLQFLIQDKVHLSIIIITLVTVCFVNWLVYEFAKLYIFHPLLVDLFRIKNTLENEKEDPRGLKKLKTGTLKEYLRSRLLDYFEQLRAPKYKVTKLINTVASLNSSSLSGGVVTKIASIDLFNFQIGLKSFSNYITNKIERRAFRSYLVEKNLVTVRLQLLVYIVSYLLAQILAMFQPRFRHLYMLDTTVPYLIVSLLLMLLLSYQVTHIRRLNLYVNIFGGMSFFLTLLFAILATPNRFETNTMDLFSLRVWFCVLLETVSSSVLCISHFLVRLISNLVIFGNTQFEMKVPFFSMELQWIMSQAVYYTLLIMLKYKSDRLVKKDFLAKYKLKLEIKKSKEKLAMLMLDFVLEKINNFEVTENFIADDAGNIAVIFCDICYFDEIVQECEFKVIDLLDEMFCTFDSLCKSFGVQKIETVGKTYMACVGLKFVENKIDNSLRRISYVQRAMNFSMEAMKYAHGFIYGAGKSIRMKIGIHYGDCIYGLLGYHKPQFSLIGDTINTTSRYCTTGKAGYIVLSESAFVHLDKNFVQATPHEEEKIPMKGKGLQKAYMFNLFGSQRVIKKPSNQGTYSNPKFNLKKEPSYGAMKQNWGFIRRGNRQASMISKASLGSIRYLNRDNDQERMGSSDQLAPSIANGKSIRPFNTTDQPVRKMETIQNNSTAYKEFVDVDEVNKNSSNPNNPNTAVKDPLQNATQNSFEDIDSLSSESDGENMAMKPKSGSKETILSKHRVSRASTVRLESGDGLQTLAGTMKGELNLGKEYFEEDKEEVGSQGSQGWLKRFLRVFHTFPTSKPYLQEYYLFKMMSMYSTNFQISLILNIVLKIISLLWYLVGELQEFGNTGLFSLRAFVLLFYIMMLSKSFVEFNPKIVKLLLVGGLTIDYIADIVGFHMMNNEEGYKMRLFQICQLCYQTQINLQIMHISGIFFLKEIIIPELLIFASALFYTLYYSPDHHLYYCFNFCLSCLLNLFDFYFDQKREIASFNSLIKVDIKSTNLSQFINRLLPLHMQDMIHSGIKTGELYQNVTLLFADIVGFTKYSSGRRPRQVVEMLSKLFTNFDKECDRLKLFKIYTIGDCYVVMSFVDNKKRRGPREEAHCVAQLGISMINIIQIVRKKIKFPELNMRIGIHTGNVYGGVIGSDLVRFDLYGEDVMLANKMESGGEAGKICVSEVTRKLLEEVETANYTFTEHKEIKLAWKPNPIKNYFMNIQNYMKKEATEEFTIDQDN